MDNVLQTCGGRCGVFPFRPDPLGPEMFSATRMSFLAVTQSLRRVFLMM